MSQVTNGKSDGKKFTIFTGDNNLFTIHLRKKHSSLLVLHKLFKFNAFKLSCKSVQ